MLCAHKIRVPENYRPRGVNNEVHFYFEWKSAKEEEKNFGKYYGRESAPPFGSPSVVARKNRFDFFRKPSLRVTNINVTSRRQRRLRANIVPDERRT